MVLVSVEGCLGMNDILLVQRKQEREATRHRPGCDPMTPPMPNWTVRGGTSEG